jgi:hypothetical protein
MAVSLMIHWPNGIIEDVPLASHAAAKDDWAPLARELGMKWVPMFYGTCFVRADNLDEITAEVRVFARELARRYPDAGIWIENLQRLVEALVRLKQTTGWDASIA